MAVPHSGTPWDGATGEVWTDVKCGDVFSVPFTDFSVPNLGGIRGGACASQALYSIQQPVSLGGIEPENTDKTWPVGDLKAQPQSVCTKTK